jgi:3-deoxy-D-manno-octulosonic-acid transferase
LRYVYNILFYLALPFILLRLFWRTRRIPGHSLHLAERLGFFSYHLEDCIWIHAVSLGETIAAIPLIQQLKQHYPQLPILITNMTFTGAERVKALFGNTVKQAYLPYDLPGATKRFLNAMKPKIAIMFETELWPNFFTICKQRHIPVVITNARLSAQSAKGYGRVPTMMRDLLSTVTLIAAQGEADAQRFIALGMPADQVVVTGNIKFDLTITAELIAKGLILRERLGKSRPVWIAASTHAGEEEIVLAAHALLRQKNPEVLLVLVPRHPERFAQVATLVEQQGLALVKHSQQATVPLETTVYLGDTLGELLLYYSASDAVFVGGSFIPLGGHNLLEPAALTKAITTGPNLFNFTDISQKLLAANALVIVNDVATLAASIGQILNNKSYRDLLGLNAKCVVEANQGALQKQLAQIQLLLSQP